MSIDPTLEHAHRFCTRNRPIIAASVVCGCFYCMKTFRPDEIIDWVDWPKDAEDQLAEGVTALCPRCGIDAVLPQPPLSLTPEFLVAMNEHWFSNAA